MGLIPEWMPNIHPLVVHFPIGILVIAVVIDLFAILIEKHKWLNQTATVLYSVGTLFAVITYFTGRIAVDTVFIPVDANTTVNEHSDLALRTILFYGIFLIIRLGVIYKYSEPKKAIKLPLLLAGMAGLFLLFETAEHGGELVYEHGLGVRIVSELSQEISEIKGKLPVDPGIIEAEDGSWFWRPVAGAEKVLTEQFEWIENSAEVLNPSVIIDPEMGSALSLNPHGVSAVFVAGKPINKIQTDLIINISEFRGSFTMIHHFQNAENYDFVTLEKGIMKLGRMEKGISNILDQSPYDDSQPWLNVSVYGSGGHFRGMKDGKNVTHGHAKDLPAGRFGFKINGNGTILINSIKTHALK